MFIIFLIFQDVTLESGQLYGFLWFSHGFPMVFPWDDAQMKHIAEYHERRLEAEPGFPELHPGSHKLSMFQIMWSTELLYIIIL